MMASKPKLTADQRALVVFSGQTELAWLRLLRPGFRHCFVLLECPGGGHGGGQGEGQVDDGRGSWVLYNPLSNGTQVDVCALGDGAALRTWFIAQGFEVVETWVRPLSPRLYCWRPFTCVEAVKRALRLAAPGVFTPWQLYQMIKKQNKEKNPLHSGMFRI